MALLAMLCASLGARAIPSPLDDYRVAQGSSYDFQPSGNEVGLPPPATAQTLDNLHPDAHAEHRDRASFFLTTTSMWSAQNGKKIEDVHKFNLFLNYLRNIDQTGGTMSPSGSREVHQLDPLKLAIFVTDSSLCPDDPSAVDNTGTGKQKQTNIAQADPDTREAFFLNQMRDIMRKIVLVLPPSQSKGAINRVEKNLEKVYKYHAPLAEKNKSFETELFRMFEYLDVWLTTENRGPNVRRATHEKAEQAIEKLLQAASRMQDHADKQAFAENLRESLTVKGYPDPQALFDELMRFLSPKPAQKCSQRGFNDVLEYMPKPWPRSSALFAAPQLLGNEDRRQDLSTISGGLTDVILRLMFANHRRKQKMRLVMNSHTRGKLEVLDEKPEEMRYLDKIIQLDMEALDLTTSPTSTVPSDRLVVVQHRLVVDRQQEDGEVQSLPEDKVLYAAYSMGPLSQLREKLQHIWSALEHQQEQKQDQASLSTFEMSFEQNIIWAVDQIKKLATDDPDAHFYLLISRFKLDMTPGTFVTSILGFWIDPSINLLHFLDEHKLSPDTFIQDTRIQPFTTVLRQQVTAVLSHLETTKFSSDALELHGAKNSAERRIPKPLSDDSSKASRATEGMISGVPDGSSSNVERHNSGLRVEPPNDVVAPEVTPHSAPLPQSRSSHNPGSALQNSVMAWLKNLEV
ncbi:hypothetical protein CAUPRSCDRAFT_10513 [Caulochytrium protostelioides]|uniref:Uncharacterized protein n=1 Tax=Caulochytrium protostelioides TaxID=1555241 RepID=A0A4P9X186_9FUNG|nr:hypothetical protein CAUPRSCDRAFT_10513 [Caulochytrium protostelioides]